MPDIKDSMTALEQHAETLREMLANDYAQDEGAGMTGFSAERAALEAAFAAGRDHANTTAAEKLRRIANELGWVMVPRKLLDEVRIRDSDSNGECRCIYHSRKAEREYESGTCPHQRLRAMLAAHAQGQIKEKKDD